MLAAFHNHGDRVAISHSSGEWTYQELLDRVHRTARALREIGVRRGNCVALLTKNSPETFVLRYAANALGACVTVLNDGLAPAIMPRMLRAVDATLLIASPRHYAGHAEAALTALPAGRVHSLGPGGPGQDVPALAAGFPADPVAVEARPEDLASIQLSGGSTGVPKGIPRDFTVRPFMSARALAGWSDTVQLLCTQLSRIGGMMADMVLGGGGRVVLHETFDPVAVLKAVESERITYISLLPSLLYRLLDQPEADSTDTSSLREIAVGGRASSPQRVARAIEVFGPVVRQDYGASECGRVAVLSPQEHLRPELLSTVGRPLPGVRVTVRDEAGAELGTGQVGELWVRGPAVMTGYHKMPEENAKVFQDGWYRTGDLGFLDADGYLSVVGRTKEVVHGGRGKVYPAEVETALLEHPAVADTVVFGTTVAPGVERLCVAVVRRPDARPGAGPSDGPDPGPTDERAEAPAGGARPEGALTEEAVAAWVAEQLGPRYVPEITLFLDAVPLTGAQKPDVAALRLLAAEADGR
jgi:fatty-acyl-CoA synthase